MSMHNTISVFAENMYGYRKEMGMTQEELADRLGMDNSYVSLLERGARVPSLITLEKVAEVFGVKPYDLLTTDENEKMTFRKMELTYLITESSSDVVDKIYQIFKELNDA